MKQLLTTNEYHQRVAKLTGAMQHVAEDLQALIEDGLRQAAHPNTGGNGSCTKLTYLIHSIAKTRQFPVRPIKKYIVEHMDARWQKLSDGTMGFKFIDGPSVTMPEVTWWEHKASNENGTAALNIHVASRLDALLKDSKKDGAKVDDQELLDKVAAVVQEHKQGKKAAA